MLGPIGTRVSGDDDSVACDEGASSVDDVVFDERGVGDDSVLVEKVVAGKEGVSGDDMVEIDMVVDDEGLSVG